MDIFPFGATDELRERVLARVVDVLVDYGHDEYDCLSLAQAITDEVLDTIIQDPGTDMDSLEEEI